MRTESLAHPEAAARNSLALDAIVEIEETAQLILLMLRSSGCEDGHDRPLRGVATRLLTLAGVALGAIDYDSDTVAGLEMALHGTRSESISGGSHD